MCNAVAHFDRIFQSGCFTGKRIRIRFAADEEYSRKPYDSGRICPRHIMLLWIELGVAGDHLKRVVNALAWANSQRWFVPESVFALAR